jgi:SnoaL-like domain
MSDLEARIAMLETRNALSELRAKYCWYTVRGERAEVLKLFTGDAVFQNFRQEGLEPVTLTGKPAMDAYFTRMKPGRRVPLVCNEVTHIDGDRAYGTCAMQSVGEDGFCGHYFDEFRKVDGQWLFSVRRFYPYSPIFRPSTEHPHP